MEIETSLKVLSLATQALTSPCSVEEALDNLVRITRELMETEQAAVLMRDESAEVFVVRSCAGFEDGETRVGHVLELPPRLRKLLWRVRSVRQLGGLETGIADLGFPLLFVPLRVKGHHVGLLVTGQPCVPMQKFGSTKRQLFTVIASLASLVIENAKTYEYLNHHFAQHSKELLAANREAAAGRDETHHLMALSLSDPTKVVRLLAASFYKELNRAGFSPGQIVTAAAEIIGCVTWEDTAPSSQAQIQRT